MLPLITFILTFLPAVVLLCCFYRTDRNRQPRKTVTLTFLYGGLTFFPVFVIENVLTRLNVTSGTNLHLFNLYDMIVNVAVPEELFKLIVIVFYSARSSAFGKPLDGIVYGATAALGFATIENTFYVLDGGLGTALTRAILAVPSHAFWGAIMGYTVGQVRFRGRKKGLILYGLLVAVILHGLFNFFLVSIEEAGAYTDAIAGFVALGLMFLLFTVFALEMIWILRTIRRLRGEQA